MVKSRAYGDGVSAEQKNSAIFTLHKVLSTVLKLLAPITPFISDKIWTILYSSSSIHAERQVESTGAKYEQSTRTTITDFTATVWTKSKASSGKRRVVKTKSKKRTIKTKVKSRTVRAKSKNTRG